MHEEAGLSGTWSNNKAIKVAKVVNAKRLKLSVEVDINGGQGNHERNALFAADKAVLDTIVMQDTVIDAFGSGTLLHYRLKGVRPTGYAGKQTQIPIGLSVNDTSVRGIGTPLARRERIQAIMIEGTAAAPL